MRETPKVPYISARKTEIPTKKSPRDLLTENPYTPTATIAQALMETSPLFAELVFVREWLQDTAPWPSPPEANTGYWKFTKHNVMQAQRTGNNRDGLVREMDPDAVNREEGKSLASDDAVRCSLYLVIPSLILFFGRVMTKA
jgi:nuclear pore complex protein Nup107